MKTCKLFAFSTLFILAIVPSVQAQATMDMSKVTCAQIIGGPVDDAIATAIWFSGYYNGKRNNTNVNLHQFRANADVVVKHCQQNPKMTVMQAVDSLRGSAK